MAKMEMEIKGLKRAARTNALNDASNTINNLFQQQQITKKQGKSDNPQAQQMQMIGKVMPIFFGFISWTLPSGLVVYFLTGNIFRIGQQALIIRIEDKEDKSDKTEKDNEENEETPETKQQEDPRKNRKKRRRK